MIPLLAALSLTLTPASPYFPAPDPDPGYGTTTLIPTYLTQGDGTRWQCAPNGFSCAPSSDGLPSYLN